MAQVRALVLRAPGTNCDHETAHAFQLAGADAERIHVQRIVEYPSILDDFQILCVAGGFSFGDDLGAGRILASILDGQLGDHLRRFRDRNKLILGICNGFQVLLKSGLLVEPDRQTREPRATLAWNDHGRYEARWVHLALRPGVCQFIERECVVTLPIAHAEGNFVVRSDDVLAELEAAGRLCVKYVDEAGKPGPFPVNPNGAMGDVAGLCDATGRVFALMPHPERYVRRTQHPRWTRLPDLPEEGAGLAIFRRAVAFFA